MTSDEQALRKGLKQWDAARTVAEELRLPRGLDPILNDFFRKEEQPKEKTP